jgi:ATP-dependent DNA helicase RecQ
MDVTGPIRPVRTKRSRPNTIKDRAMKMFAEQKPVDEVARETGRAASTVYGYLAEYIQNERPDRIDAWVPPALYQRIIEAATAIASEGRFKPIYDHLEGEVPYEILRLVITHHRATVEAGGTVETQQDER